MKTNASSDAFNASSDAFNASLEMKSEQEEIEYSPITLGERRMSEVSSLNQRH